VIAHRGRGPSETFFDCSQKLQWFAQRSGNRSGETKFQIEKKNGTLK
jgi:hypothetical protein